jgi:broad specificity phosphatase PhoE
MARQHTIMREGQDVDANSTLGHSTSLFSEVYLCRHGETDLNASGRLRGRSDPDLNATGHEQAEVLALALERVSPGAILASPLLRTRHTADAIAARCGLSVDICDELLDRDYGPQNGRLAEDVKARWGSIDRAPGVESWGSVLERGQAALAEVASRETHAPIVLVSHDAFNSALLADLDPTRWPDPRAVPQPTGCLNVLRREDVTWVVLIAGWQPGVSLEVAGTTGSPRP